MSRTSTFAALLLLSMFWGCGGGGSSAVVPAGAGVQVGAGQHLSGGTPPNNPVAPGVKGSVTALIPPVPGNGLPLPAAVQAQSGGSNSATTAPVDVSGFSLGLLPGTVPQRPANWDSVKNELETKHSSAAVKSASDASLYSLTPFDPHTIAARNQFAPPNGGINGVLDCYEYMTSDDPTTPVLETFNAQHLSNSNTELHVWGSVTNSSVIDMIYAQIGLVTDYTYNFAMDPNQDGDPADAVPPYMFNQNVGMMNAVASGTPFVAPLDLNGKNGMGFATGYAPATGYDFDLKLTPNQAPGAAGGRCWLRIRPRVTPYQPWSAYAGDPLNPATGMRYGTDNWGWRPAEDFSSALLIAQIYSYNPTGAVGRITFQYVQATEGPLDVPTVDCTRLSDARFLIASPGADGLQGTGDDTALTGWNSTNSPVNAESVLLIGDYFYVFFDNDPAQVNDIELYPSLPVAGMVQYTTRGFIADTALAGYFDLPDNVPGYPGKVYSALHPFRLVLRDGAYNRITNDMTSLNWASFQIATNPGFTAITPVRATNGSAADRVILAEGVQYTPFYYSLGYSDAGSYPPPLGFGAPEVIYPSAHTTGFIQVGYNALTEGGTVLGNYYNQAGLTNTLQADAYCRFETRALWGAAPLYGMADADLMAWITLPTLDARSQPWNTMVYARGVNFLLQTADISASPTVNVAANHMLDAGLGAMKDVSFNTTGGGGPYPGSFNVLPVRVYDDPAQTDPDANVMQVGDGWDVTFNFLLQYGALAGSPPAPAYTVELDGDWGGNWDDGTPGRVYSLPGSPYNAPGPHSSTMHISSLMQPSGTYRMAIRVTDGNGDQYTYVWPRLVILPATASWHFSVAGNIIRWSTMPSQELVNGNPAIAWCGGPGNGCDLMYARANDALGSVWNAPVILEAKPGVVNGMYPSLKVVNNRPAVAYDGGFASFPRERLCYMRANDINGNTWGTSIVLDFNSVNGRYPSMVIVNGRPAIAYQQLSWSNAYYVRSNDVDGSAWGTPVSAGISDGIMGSMCVVNGNPAISSQNFGPNQSCYYTRATDIDGAAWGGSVLLGPLNGGGVGTCLQVVAGMPAVSFSIGTPQHLTYMRANDVSGATWGALQTIDNIRRADAEASMAVIGGYPSIAYYVEPNRDLYYVQATTNTGSAWGAPTLVDSAGDVGLFPCLMEVAGNPGIAYTDASNSTIKYAHYH